jgi:tetratricopeptide (TPR) repeat protein
MNWGADLAGRYYRLGLAAAKRRDVSLALQYAERACVLDSLYRSGDAPFETPPDSGVQHLAEICRYELGEGAAAFEDADQQKMEQVIVLVGQKKWRAAAAVAKSFSTQSVRPLNIQGCLWALANRYAQAADCFTKALAKDRGNRLATDALVEIGKRRMYFWRFF